jgi:hypothetical protein
MDGRSSALLHWRLGKTGGFAQMAGGEELKRVSEVDAKDVASCVREINHAIGELARRYGAASVVVALTEVMGCASCATDSVERGASIRALMDRMTGARQA